MNERDLRAAGFSPAYIAGATVSRKRKKPPAPDFTDGQLRELLHLVKMRTVKASEALELFSQEPQQYSATLSSLRQEMVELESLRVAIMAVAARLP